MSENGKTRCCICTEEVPEDRRRLKGYAAVTCKQSCLEAFRNSRKRSPKGHRVNAQEWAYVLRIRRAIAKGIPNINLTLCEANGTSEQGVNE